MKKSIILCIMVLFMTSAILTAQVPEWQWAEQAGGVSTDYGSGISVDANGNSYGTGRFKGTATFGADTLTSSGDYDVFVAKIDADGNCQWAKQAGGPFTCYGSGISVDANGNSYVTGSFSGTATFGAFTLTSSGSGDVFVAKIDTDGNCQWAINAGGSSGDYGSGISVDANGNSYVTGRFEGIATFGADTLTSSGLRDVFVAKLDADGNWQWAKQAGGSSYDYGYGISVDANGNSYVTGNFELTAIFGAFTLTSSGSNDIFVAKLDTDGNWQWAKQAGGSVGDTGSGISVDANGNSYGTGRFAGTATFGADTLTSIVGGHDIFVAKFDADGNWQWAKQAVGAGADYDYGNGISLDADGNSYVTGYFEGTATFGTTTITSSGDDDVFVAKIDADGNWQWAKQAGGSKDDRCYGISVDADGNSYVTGGFKATAYFGAFTLTSSGTYNVDIFVAKLDTDGNWQWAKQAVGAEFVTSRGQGISVSANGNSYVTGYFMGTATFGTTTLTSSGTYDVDVFVAKIDTDGNWLWAKQAGGSNNDRGYAISVSANGNSYVTGFFSGTATFGTTTLTSIGGDDVFVAKFDTDGNWQWVKQAGGTDWETGYGISVDANGNSYVTGYFYDIAVFGADTLTSTGSSDQDIFVGKMDADGNWQWAKQAGGSGSDEGKGISVDANGNSYVTGNFQATAAFGADSLTSSGNYDVFVAKIVEPIIGDFNSDGYVDAADLQLLGDHWHFVTADPGWDALYDLEPDGIIDAGDLQVFGDHWHEGTPPTPLLVKGKDGKGPNEDAGIVFDLDATTYGNQNLTSIPSQPAGTNIRVDVYCTDVVNLDTYEFEVIYNPTELSYVSAYATNPITDEPNILTTNGGAAIAWMIDSSTPGVLSLAYTLTGNDPAQAPEGEGLIADIKFQALVDTYGTLSFGDVYYYDTYGVVDLITDTGTATLPVELSSFTAIYNTVSGFVSLIGQLQVKRM